MINTNKNPTTKEKSFTVSFNYQNLIWMLVILNVLTIFLWKPWDTSSSTDRTISVSGEATIEAEPDRFQFSPQFELMDDSKDGVLDKASKKANEVVDGLKALGVEEKDIKLNSSSYDDWWYSEDDDTNYAYVNLTVEANDKDFAQEIQDFLLTTEPEGQITPWPTFSEDKQAELEQQARTQAIADARAKAEQSATELGAKVGEVITISEGNGFGDYPIAYAVEDTALSSEGSDEVRSLPILPGENEYTFTLSVVFALK